MKKRATALLLILLMVVSLMPALGAGALAAENTVDITPTTSNPEESVTIAVGDTLTINVTNGGSSTYDFSATLSKEGVAQIQPSSVHLEAKATGTFTVTGVADGTVDITISNGTSSYSRKGTIHLTVGDGGSAPVDPPAGNTVDITPESSNSPTVPASIDVGDTLIINVKNGSSSSTYTFTATLSNTDVAELQGSSSVSIAAGATGQLTVKGLADGTVDIVIQSNGQYSTRKGTINLTVGDGGSAPVDPPADKTVNITPDADNIPEEEVSIGVGETLAINVKNASTRSGYDFEATASKSGVVEIRPSSVNVAAGSTGTFIVTGLTDGTVDITISNNNSNSERKAIIHVTVGTGGSEEPPTPGTETRYVETSSFVLDGEYVIGAIKDDSSVYAIQKNGSSAKVKSLELSVSTNENDGKAYVVTSEATAVWEYGSDSFLHNGSDCLFPTSSNGVTAYPDTQSNLREITFTDNHKLSFVSGSGTTYFITCSNGTFDTSTTEADAATFRLFVKTEEDPGPVSVTGVTLDKETMALTVGGTGTLTATVAPGDAANKNVTWSSSDETVATVNDGTVTALKAGTAVITVKTVDGEWTASCTVTVTAPVEIEFSVIELTKLNNSSVWMVQVEEEAGKGITYKGDAMVWSSRYEAYVIAVEGATKPAPVAADFATSGDAAAAVEYPAANDANGSKKVDMADVQYIYNLHNGKYESLTTAGGLTKVLGADINGDGVIDSKDATPILTALRGAQA